MPPITQRLGILGGTFDPIHIGHLILASELRSALALDRVLLIPNAHSPFKATNHVTPPHHRLAMLHLAAADTSWLEVSSLEIDRGGTSYTVDTLTTLTHDLPETTLVFLMGADSLPDLPRWRRPAEIVTLAEIGVASRPGAIVDTRSIFDALPSATGRIFVVPTPNIAISATDIRARIRTGRPITFHVPSPVERYIITHRLYRD